MTTLERRLHAANSPARGRAAPHIPPRRAPAHVIRDDAEALAVARQLAAEFAAGAAERDAERLLPLAEVDRCSQSGLWGITVPRAFGGAEVSHVTLAEVTAVIAESDANLGQIPQNHFYMVEALRLAGTEAQQRHFLGRVLAGDRLGNAFAEIGTRRSVDFQTRLTRQGDGWRLDGQKFYSTGALFAHIVVAVAADPDGRSTLVFLERATPGLQLVDDWSSFGQRTTGSGTTLFDAIDVSPFDVVPHQVVFDQPTPMGPLAQLVHAAVDVGIARAALTDALDFTRRHARPFFETDYAKATDDPHVVAETGALALRVSAANAMLRRAARAVDAARAKTTDESVAVASIAVAEAKALATEVSVHVASKLFEVTGSRSTLAEYDLDRHWRNARVHTLHDPVRYKYVNIGNFYINGVRPPRHGAI